MLLIVQQPLTLHGPWGHSAKRAPNASPQATRLAVSRRAQYYNSLNIAEVDGRGALPEGGEAAGLAGQLGGGLSAFLLVARIVAVVGGVGGGAGG
eukprot:15445329-Alexandrium_andersonii.AAC.1